MYVRKFGKVKAAIKAGAQLLIFLSWDESLWASRWIYHWVCDVWL